MFYDFLIYLVFPFLCLQSVQENNLVENLYRSVTTYSSGFAALYLVQAILYEQGSMKTGAPSKVWGIPYFYGGPPSTGSTTLTQSRPVPGGQGWLGAPLWGLLTSTLSLYTPLYIFLTLIHCSKLEKKDRRETCAAHRHSSHLDWIELWQTLSCEKYYVFRFLVIYMNISFRRQQTKDLRNIFFFGCQWASSLDLHPSSFLPQSYLQSHLGFCFLPQVHLY